MSAITVAYLILLVVPLVAAYAAMVFAHAMSRRHPTRAPYEWLVVTAIVVVAIGPLALIPVVLAMLTIARVRDADDTKEAT